MRFIKTKSGESILSPKNDHVFKRVFGDERNKGILAAFLAGVLGFDRDELELTILNTELVPQTENDKAVRLDVCVKETLIKCQRAFNQCFLPCNCVMK